MHSAYSAPHAKETHAGRQCADQRNVNNKDALFTHKTQNTHNTEVKCTIIIQEVK